MDLMAFVWCRCCVERKGWIVNTAKICGSSGVLDRILDFDGVLEDVCVIVVGRVVGVLQERDGSKRVLDIDRIL
jgi:hypothetical protein